MNQYETDKLLDRLHSHKLITRPTAEELYNPDYALYGLAPFWTVEQAICLLSGIATLDEETVKTLTAISGINEHWIRIEGIQAEPDISVYTTFIDYVVQELPIQSRTITILKNVHKIINQALHEHYLHHDSSDQHNVLLDPVKVVALAKLQQVAVSSILESTLQKRTIIAFYQLPEVFPNQICFIGEFNAMRIEKNMSKPRYASGGYSQFNLMSPQPPNNTNQDPIDSSLEDPKDTKDGEPESKAELSPAARAFLEKVTDARREAVDLCIQTERTDANQQARLRFLVEKFAIPRTEEFFKYKTSRLPPMLLTQHRCRAVAQFLRHLISNMKILQLERDACMIKFGFDKTKPKSKTFREWMNREGIIDRKSKDQK